MKYSTKWDLSSIPTALLGAELRRRSPNKPKSLVPCINPKCKAPLGARERRQPCPHCGAKNPR